MFVLVMCRAGIRFGGECKFWWVQGSAEVARIRYGAFRSQFGGDEKVQRAEARWGGACEVASRARLTLGLHPGAHRSQWVTGPLATGCGHCHGRQTDQATGVLHVPA